MRCLINMKARVIGSFTIEAALIMPIILFVILSLMYLTFYLHDINRISCMVDKALFRAGYLMKHETNFLTGDIHYENINDRGVLFTIFGDTNIEEADIKKHLELQLGKGLLLAKIEQINISTRKSSIMISVVSNIEIPFDGVRDYLWPERQLIISGQEKVHNPAETVRISEVVLDTGSKIKGMDVLRKKLDKILN